MRIQTVGHSGLAVLVLLGGCTFTLGEPEAWEPDGSTGPSAETTTDGPPLEPSSGPVADETGTSSSLDTGPAESSSGGAGPDCTPWPTPWIGAPCMQDGDCAYDGGICLRDDEGFPCGTCSQPCEMLCLAILYWREDTTTATAQLFAECLRESSAELIDTAGV